jgi:hypothetical protein
MHPPPKKRNPAVRPSTNGGNETKLAIAKVQQPLSEGKLWPANVSRLQSLGIKFDHRPADHDIKVACPICHEGVLLIAESKPWHYCPAPTCPSWLMPFEDVVAALVEEARKA